MATHIALIFSLALLICIQVSNADENFRTRKKVDEAAERVNLEAEFSVLDARNNLPTQSKYRTVKDLTWGSDSLIHHEANLHRVKRSHVGSGIPHAFDMKLETPESTEFEVASLRSYRCTISASAIATDVVIEIFSETSGLPYFVISDVRFNHIGSNLAPFTSQAAEITYYAKYNSGRYDSVTINLGTITNSASDLEISSANEIEILFDAVAVMREGLVDGEVYTISVGALFNSYTMQVAHDELTYRSTTSDPTNWDYSYFSAEGPDTLSVGKTGVWKVTAQIFDQYYDLFIDVFILEPESEFLSIDSISVTTIGENYVRNVHDASVNFTRQTFEGHGIAARLDLGAIVNSGYHTKDYEFSKNTIVFEVAISMLNDSISASPYDINFVVWKGGICDVQTSFTSILSVQPTAEQPLDTDTAIEVTATPSKDIVTFGSRFGILMEVFIPTDSTLNLQVEATSPVLDSTVTVVLNRIRVSAVGFNFPHFASSRDIHTEYSSDVDGELFNKATIDLAGLDNTGQRNSPSDSVIQIEILCELLESAGDVYSNGSKIIMDLKATVSDTVSFTTSAYVTVSSDPVTYTASQLPSFTWVNVMGLDAEIYSESAAVMDLEVVLPATMYYDVLKFEVAVANVGGPATVTLIKIVESTVVDIDDTVLLDVHNVTYSGIEDEVEANGDAVFNKVTLYLKKIANIGFEERLFRVRTFVIAREATTPDLLYAGVTQWVDVAVDFAGEYTYTASAQLTYADSYDNYDGKDWQPRKELTLAEGYDTNVVRPGGLLKYNVAVNIPYRTSAPVRVAAESLTPPIQICQVALTHMGDAIVNYYPPKYTDAQVEYNATTMRMVSSYNSIPTVTSFGYGDYVGNTSDAYLNYTVVLMLSDTAVAGQVYDFYTEIQFGQTELSFWSPQVNTSDGVPEMLALPVFNISHQMETYTINIGGSEVYYFDMYIPPQTSYKYDVRIYAPHSASMFGEYEILDAFITYAGSDLACFNAYTAEVTTPNTATSENLANFAIGFVPNVAVGDFIPADENKIRLAVHVAMLANTTLAPGTIVPLTVSVSINDGRERWVGDLDVEVILPEDDHNVVPTSNMTLHIDAQGDMLFSVGENQTYTGVVTFPAGVAVTNLQLIVESPLEDGEALYTVSKPTMLSFGSNLQEARKYHEFSEEENDFWHLYTHTVDFGFVRNLDLSGISDFVNQTLDEDNKITFEFSIRLMDHITLKDGHQFEMIAYVMYNTENVTAEGDTTLTVHAPVGDTTLFDWNVISTLDENQTYVLFDSVVSFQLEIGLNPDSKRFPENVTVLYRVPKFSALVPGSLSFSGLDSAFTYSSEVNDYGLQLHWNKLRYGNDAHVNFSITVDPDKYVEFGLLSKYLSVPVDIQYYEEDKNNIGVITELYTSVKVLEIEFYIPECLDPLGMKDGTIKDCQISSSIESGAYTAVDSRADGGSGWMTVDRGPPFFQHEYIQVDVGHKVRVTGVTIQPVNGAEAHRVTSFKVQYSWLGILWEYVKESGEDKVFTVSWPDVVTSDTSVLVEFLDLAFFTRYIRIVPQENSNSSYIHALRFELHGCPWPYKTVPDAYNCPTNDGSLKSYYERQMLAVEDTVYICMISEPNTLPYCSGSNDFASTWFGIDDNVMNILGYETEGEATYALARNRLTTLRSTDKGHTWAMVEESDFAAMSSLSTYIPSQELSFPVQGETFNDYEYTDGGTFAWTASNLALHARPTTDAGIAAVASDDNKVARWGTTE